mgnify:CR=1 FL=1
MKFQSLGEMDVIIQPPYEASKVVARSWKERFFTFPFNPFKSTKIITYSAELVEDGKVIKTGQRLIMNQKTFNKMKAELK